MEYIVFAAVLFFIILILVIREFIHYRKKEKDFIRGLYDNYGILPQKEYKSERVESISHYFEKHKTGFYIDDITWNDLNMDEIFRQMNYTMSAAGEEYLYYMLRTPSFDREESGKQEELISFFSNNPDIRVACQVMFSKLGGTGKFSIYDYLDYLKDLGERSNRIHYISFILVFICIGVLFVNLPVGLLLLVCVFVSNILSYFKIKGEIDPYITSFSYIFRLLNMADKLREKNIPVLSRENRLLGESLKKFAKFKRGSFLLMSPGRMTASSNLIDIVFDYLRMIFHLDLIKFNWMLKEVREYISDIDQMITIEGRIDAIIAVGAYRKGNPDYCIPEFSEKSMITAVNLYHPLIESPVKNEISEAGSILITGSNASGKSTFLKTVAINAILAQTVHTCMADSYKAGMFRVCSSMTLRDDIQGGDSYYMVEIKALKRILDERKKDGAPVLCFVDEVLRGTNTVERIAASAQILKSLCGKNSICFAATHDIELTHLLEGIYTNYHFEEEIEGNDISFSYKILNGRAATRNAIKLLSIMGYDNVIVKEAEKMAADFLEKGSWT